MMKELVFDEDAVGRKRGELFWDGIVIGSQGGAPAPKSRAVIRREAALQRKVITVTDPTLEFDRTQRPSNARSLKSGVQTLHLTVEDISLAIELIEKWPWGGAQVLEVADLFDFLEGARSVQESA